jgi:hypothetical protein
MLIAAACSLVISLRMAVPATLTERADYDDKIAWVLPKDRLDAFAAQGVVIVEEHRMSIVAIADVTRGRAGTFSYSADVTKTTVDVPRHAVDSSSATTHDVLDAQNRPVPARRIDLESAAVVGLPPRSLCAGESWSTQLPVDTSLGSGVATFTHTIAGVDGDLVQIDIRAAGAITGREYNLPRLLPGSISLTGSAWYDTRRGLIVQESYLIRDRLLKTTRGKTIGFDETETVDARTTLSPPRR